MLPEEDIVYEVPSDDQLMIELIDIFKIAESSNSSYNFATLVNIGCAVKKMVHHTFKNMVPTQILRILKRACLNTIIPIRYRHFSI